MLFGRIVADLPSAEHSGAAPGDDAFAPSHDRLSVGTLQVLTLLQDALVAADVRDLASLSVDGRDVYRDVGGVTTDEVDELLQRAAELGVLVGSFKEIVLVLYGEDASARHVFDVRIRSQVPAGEPELVARVSTRPKSLDIVAGETAQAFVQRLDAVFRDPDALADLRAQATQVYDRVADALRTTMEGASVVATEVRLAITRPTRQDLESIAGLGFGVTTRMPRYLLARRDPAWSDPAIGVVEDDYVVLRNLIALDALLQSEPLRQPWVSVIDPSGKLLFAANAARSFEDMPWRRHFQRVWVGEGVTVRWATP